MAYCTWQKMQSINNLFSSWLHAYSVFTHHQSKHDKREYLTCVCLQSFNVVAFHKVTAETQYLFCTDIPLGRVMLIIYLTQAGPL